MYDSNENSGFLDDGGNIANRFSEITLLSDSQNGYSELYKAKRYGQWFALKRLLPEVSDAVGYRNLLQKEFLIAVSLNHPHIAKTLSMEVVEGLGLCIVEEYVDGETWDAFFHRTQPGRKETLRIVGELCDALDYLHSRQYAHRDLKPSNVMLTHNGHHVKLLDFGLADNDSFDIIKTVAGSARYAAPELREDVPYDGRCDIYSLGVMLGELPQPWPALSRVVRGCCHTRPDDRYASAGEVYRTLMRRGGYWKPLATVAVLLAAGAVSLYLAEKGNYSPETVSSTDTARSAGVGVVAERTGLSQEDSPAVPLVGEMVDNPWLLRKQLKPEAIAAAQKIVEQARPLLNDSDYPSSFAAQKAISQKLSVENAKVVAKSLLDGRMDEDNPLYKGTYEGLCEDVYGEFFDMIVQSVSDFLSQWEPDGYTSGDTLHYTVVNELTGERVVLNWTALYQKKHGNDWFYTLTFAEKMRLAMYRHDCPDDTISDEAFIERLRKGEIK